MDRRKLSAAGLMIVATVASVWYLSDTHTGPPVSTTTAAAVALPNKNQQQQKPICSQIVVPTGADCIPQHMANLPPDPGEAGKLTIEGIDSDKDGLRDDVQRYIVETWWPSERAIKALTLVAQTKQQQVILGNSLGQEETRKQMPNISRINACYMALESPEMLRLNAYEQAQLKVTNTPERWLRSKEFDYQFANGAFLLGQDIAPAEACGFDPATLPN